MSVSPFFDTTILIYSIWEIDARAADAEALLKAGGHINVQVLNEFASVARRKLKMSCGPDSRVRAEDRRQVRLQHL
jgi:predicted nucleic acid-binding protein